MENEPIAIIENARALIEQSRFSECEAVLSTAMFESPHSAVPHNLMGLLLEHEGLHPEAMRHFRAAYALDPTYLPARRNMECYGGLCRIGRPAYQEENNAATESKMPQKELTCTL